MNEGRRERGMRTFQKTEWKKKGKGAKFAFIMSWRNLENALEELKEVF